jgi:hypothetical protein
VLYCKIPSLCTTRSSEKIENCLLFGISMMNQIENSICDYDPITFTIRLLHLHAKFGYHITYNIIHINIILKINSTRHEN